MRFFSPHFILRLIAAFFALAMGCGNQAVDAEKLVGTWKINVGIAAGTMTFSEDFTYSAQVVSLFGNETVTGEWRIDEDRLIIVIKTHSDDPNKVGREEIHKVVKIDGAALVLQTQKKNGEWQSPNTFIRVK